ncbi:MAG: multiple antibiotic resistance protein [Saprospiraceae bacterium]|jgi:multiple antibiotic resistance protein
MSEIFLAVYAALFSLVNPFGAVPVFLAMTPNMTKEERKETALHSSIYVFLILLTFFLAGSAILGFFGISLEALRIAGGIIIFGSGAQLLSGKMAQSRAINKEVTDEAIDKEDISFTPLAMPLLAGPGSISLVIGYFSTYPDWTSRGTVILALLVFGITVFSILRASPVIFKVLGVAGIKAISRIMGFLVMAIGIELIISSIRQILIAG